VENNAKPEEPAAITIGGFAVLGFNDPALFQKYVQDPVKKKYPHTVNFAQGGNFGNIIASGDVPDIFIYHKSQEDSDLIR
jgi:hypothetical protein